MEIKPENIKDEVAIKNGYESWNLAILGYVMNNNPTNYQILIMENEAIQLYHLKKTNEKQKLKS